MNLKLLTTAALSALCVPMSAQAALITWDFGKVYNGLAPTNTAPWLRVTLTDAAPNQVTIKFTSLLGVSAAPYVEQFDFNLTSIPTLATVGTPTSSGAFTAPTYAASSNAYAASTGGNFDLKFSFDTSGNNANKRFSDLDTYELTLSGAGLSTSSFNTPSSGGTTGPYLAAAHLQGTPSTDSWVTVPEPATLGTVVAAGILALRRRRRPA